MKPGLPPLPPVPETMDWEKFRENGHKVVDFIADYYQSLKTRKIPPQSSVEPGYLKQLIPEKEAPAHPGASFDSILETINTSIVPGMTHWQHPDFYAWFPAQLSPAALLGDTIASSLNQPGFNWMASPAASELEVIVTDWLARAFGLPESMTWEGTGGGVLQPTASEAAVVAVLAAKNRSLDRFKTDEEKQVASNKLVCYVSDQAHFCTEKATRVLSIWHVRRIKTHRTPDGNYPMMAEDIQAAMEADVKAGLIPCFIGENFGTTGVCATDDFERIANLPLVKEYNVWLNLDAAYAGAVAVCPEMRAAVQPALDTVDSLWVNGSKWFSMMTNTSFQFFKDRRYVVQSLSATGEYLSNKYTNENMVVDFKDYQLGLGRPFRALKVYTTLKFMGLEGIQTTIRRHCALAQYLYQLLESHGDLFELPLPAKFGLVCFRLKNDEDSKKTKKMLELLQNEHRIMLVHSDLEGKTILRLALAYPGLTGEDMDQLVEYLVQKGQEASA